MTEFNAEAAPSETLEALLVGVGPQGPRGPVGGIEWDTPTAEALAAIQGYWVVASETPPAETEMYGVPVVWIDPATTLTPVPVQPPQPTWDDINSTVTIPAGVAGVKYLISGGGYPAGTEAVQGATLTTSGAFPRQVSVAPVALPGYALFGPLSRTHHFPDPGAITVLTSDGFSGAQVNTIVARSSDVALGGATRQWQTDNNAGTNTHLVSANQTRTFRINASGQLEHADVAGDYQLAMRWPATTAKNLRLEFTVVSISNNGGGWTDAPFQFKIDRKPAGTPTQANDSIYYKGIQVSVGAQRVRVFSTKVGGGNQELIDANASGSGTVAGANTTGGTWPVVGNWSLTLHETTLTIVSPGGTRVWDLSDTALYDLGGVDPTGSHIAISSDLANKALVLDNVKVSRVGT